MEDWIQEICLISVVTLGQQNPKHLKTHGIAQLKKKEIIAESYHQEGNKKHDR